MASLQIISCALLCLLWGFQTHSITTSMSGGRCRLESQYPTEFEIDIEHNGQTYTDQTITINEYRGYKCRQSLSSESSNFCHSSRTLPSSFSVDTNGGTYQGTTTKRMCAPQNTTTVTRTVSVNVGQSTVSVTVEWSNITNCTCQTIT